MQDDMISLFSLC